MRFTLKPTDPNKLEVDALIVFCWEKGRGELDHLDKQLLSVIKEAAVKEEFEGKAGQYLTLNTHGRIAPYKLMLAGLGKLDNFNLNDLYTSAAKTIKQVQEIKPAKVAIIVPDLWLQKFTAASVTQAIVEAISCATYHFFKYKSEKEKEKRKDIEEIILQLPANKLSAAEIGIMLGSITSAATYLARDLINEPSEITTPTFLASIAENLSKSSKGLIKVQVMDKEQIIKLGMGAYWGVAKGSDEPPKFIRLNYKPKRPKKKIVIIGKGITFDTGGLSLKSSEHMETMKMDMAGAAAVLSIFSVLPLLTVESEVVGLIPACENMPSGHALKPGDILKAMNGKTIEVLNTDAEGRLTLADAISFAVSKERPDEVIDLATLTGACMVALGQEIAGLWGNNEKLLKAIEESASSCAEKVWRMPLEKDYKELIKSHIADIKNVQTGKYGGAITAALFLSEFIEQIPWAHLDIAGPAYEEKDTSLVPIGAAGFGVRLLLHYLSKGT